MLAVIPPCMTESGLLKYNLYCPGQRKYLMNRECKNRKNKNKNYLIGPDNGRHTRHIEALNEASDGRQGADNVYIGELLHGGL